MRGSSRASASTALRPCSGSDPACAERPRATTSSQRPPLRAATTAPPGRPHSMQRTASKPASRAWVAIGSERTSSSGTLHELEAREGALARREHARGVRGDRDPALHVGRAGPEQATVAALAAAAPRRCRAAARCRGGRAARHARAAGALERRVHVQARGRRHELGRQAVARERARDVAGEQVELVASAPLGESCATQRARSASTSSRSPATASCTCLAVAIASGTRRGYNPWMRVGGQ